MHSTLLYITHNLTIVPTIEDYYYYYYQFFVSNLDDNTYTTIYYIHIHSLHYILRPAYNYINHTNTREPDLPRTAHQYRRRYPKISQPLLDSLSLEHFEVLKPTAQPLRYLYTDEDVLTGHDMVRHCFLDYIWVTRQAYIVRPADVRKFPTLSHSPIFNSLSIPKWPSKTSSSHI